MSRFASYPRRRTAGIRGETCVRAAAGAVAALRGPAVVEPAGDVVSAGSGELDRLYHCLDGVTPESHPRTARLLESGTRKPAQKVIEEAGEVALEAVKHDVAGVVRESADLLYQLVVLWRRMGARPSDVWDEMRRRADLLGIAEKLPKRPPQEPHALKSGLKSES